jgi:serine/threonine-protein kinase
MNAQSSACTINKTIPLSSSAFILDSHEKTIKDKITKLLLPQIDRISSEKSSYSMVKKLGNGGMGSVWLARDEYTGNEVAIKLSLTEDDTFLMREQWALSEMNHPNIVRALDEGHIEGRYFFVMEHLSGKDLKSTIDAHGTIDMETAVEITLQTLAGLEAIHKNNLIHCDLKPANVYLAETEYSIEVKIIDFGLVRGINEPPATAAFGTPGFSSPEQMSCSPVDERTDIYSAGVILFNMLTGKELFRGNDESLIEHTRKSSPPLPSEIIPDINPLLEHTVLRALEKNPEKRFRSAGEMRERLEIVLDVLTN